ncbi:MAG: acyl CoA:acetate/3-ketoacid CoA transferase [Betaproteobacteria bacterium]|nr:acyl CoA:acetate/3-ketoacid CoA transferase [Betaproteobacteria bacterium]
MRASKVVDAARAVALVPDGAVVAVSSSSGLNTPDSTLKALGDRFRTTGHPRGITLVMPISAGDMYGIKGIDHLAEPGLLARVIGGSYPSGPSSFEPPRIRRMIADNAVAAWNLPSGVIFDMLRDAAAKRPGVLTKVGMGTYVDPRLEGGRMNEAARPDIVRVVEFGGQEWLHFDNFYPQVGIVRGTTADEDGNVSMEHEGAFLGNVEVALAARNSGGVVIAQVKRVAARGSLHPQRVVVPSTLVDFVVVDPHQKQATEIEYDPALSGEVRLPASAFEPVPFGPDKVIARRAAMELRRGDAVNLGFGISPLVPYVLIEEGQGDAVTWAIEQGPVGGVPAPGFPFGCAYNAEAIFPSPYQFTYFQGGGSDCGLLSFLEIGADGSVNVSKLGSHPHVTAGCGGFVDITARARKLVFSGYFRAAGIELAIEDAKMRIVREGRFAKFVPAVEQVTFSGRRALEQGQRAIYVTERCVIELRPEGLTVTEVAPGIDVERDVVRQAACPLRVASDLKAMDPRLFDPAPMRLELPQRLHRALA